MLDIGLPVRRRLGVRTRRWRWLASRVCCGWNWKRLGRGGASFWNWLGHAGSRSGRPCCGWV
eukprot:142182-Prymnesium_polylepis.1